MPRFRRNDGSTFVLHGTLDEHALVVEERLNKLRAKERAGEAEWKVPAEQIAENDKKWDAYTVATVQGILTAEVIG